MRLDPVVLYISFPIYRFTSYSCVALYLKNFAGRCKLIDTMSAKGKYSILTDAVLSIRSDTIYGPRLSDCWLPASTWVEALQELNLIDASIAIDVRKFNTAMSKSPLFGEKMSRFDGSNTTGVFRVTFQNKFFYYFTQESNQVRYPVPLNGAWKDKVMAAASNVLVIPSTRARPALTTRVDIQVVDTNTAVTTRNGIYRRGRNCWPLKGRRVSLLSTCLPACYCAACFLHERWSLQRLGSVTTSMAIQKKHITLASCGFSSGWYDSFKRRNIGPPAASSNTNCVTEAMISLSLLSNKLLTHWSVQFDTPSIERLNVL
jgi:hypothetical protein